MSLTANDPTPTHAIKTYAGWRGLRGWARNRKDNRPTPPQPLPLPPWRSDGHLGEVAGHLSRKRRKLRTSVLNCAATSTLLT